MDARRAASASAGRRVRSGTCASRAPSRLHQFRAISRQPRTVAIERASPRGEGGGAAREGRALLQGLIRCGRCGRRMQVGYWGKTLVPNYSCVRGNQLYGTERCQSVGGRRIERVGSPPCSGSVAAGRDRATPARSSS